MYFGRTVQVLFATLLLAGCGGVMNDLNPSGSDKRTPVVAGTTGPGVGQQATDFTLSDTLGTSVNLSSELSGTTIKGVVLYFTMWCPLCETHMTQMRDTIIPLYPDVTFFAIDYVSGTVADARAAELNSGLSGAGFRVLADTHQAVANAYLGTMGVTVVIDKTGIIRMNEDFKDGTRLNAALASLP